MVPVEPIMAVWLPIACLWHVQGTACGLGFYLGQHIAAVLYPLFTPLQDQIGVLFTLHTGALVFREVLT